MKDLIAYGTPFMDCLVHIDHLPSRKDEGARILEQSWQGGGKVSSALAAFGQLGRESSMMGVLGDDSYGRFLLRDFAKYRVDTTHVVQDGTNGFSFVLSDPISKGRNIIAVGPKARRLTPEDIDEEFVGGHRLLHLENGDDVSLRLADIVHANGGQVSYDADSYSEEGLALIPKLDIFIGSEFFYRSMFQDDDYAKNLAEVAKLGPKVVVFTLGERGSVAYCDGECRLLPGYKVEVVDTVGAGDVYHGAYLFAWCEGMDPFECARFANAVSAIKCTGIGGRSAIPDYPMTLDFMKNGVFSRTLIDQKTLYYRDFHG